jgi:uncharacterized protein YcaQ
LLSVSAEGAIVCGAQFDRENVLHHLKTNIFSQVDSLSIPHYIPLVQRLRGYPRVRSDDSLSLRKVLQPQTASGWHKDVTLDKA